MATASQRRQLGAFLRARRDQLRPGDFGLAPGQRRRAPGLRREEVALLCGLSPTWIAWIEQGRTTAISVASLAAIARGLRLSRAERRYLFQLAARRDPSPQGAARWNLDELRPLVNAVRGPAYVLDPSWSPLIWNNAAAVLFRGWLHRHDEEPASGLLEYVFLAPDARRFIVGWPARARRLVAEFRADTAASPDDAVRDAQIEDLRAASARLPPSVGRAGSAGPRRWRAQLPAGTRTSTQLPPVHAATGRLAATEAGRARGRGSGPQVEHQRRDQQHPLERRDHQRHRRQRPELHHGRCPVRDDRNVEAQREQHAEPLQRCVTAREDGEERGEPELQSAVDDQVFATGRPRSATRNPGWSPCATD